MTKISTTALNMLITGASAKHNVEPNLIKAVIKAESNFDPMAHRAEPHIYDTSWGLMQVLLGTAKWMTGDDNLLVSELLDPARNIDIGTQYLSYQLTKYKGKKRDAIAAYNMGTVKKRPDGTYLNQPYVDRVYGYYLMYEGAGVASRLGAGITVGLLVYMVSRR